MPGFVHQLNTYQDSECVPCILLIQVGIINCQKTIIIMQEHWNLHDGELVERHISWSCGTAGRSVRSHCGISTQTNEGHIATLHERKCHFANWADSSRLHNRASSCILQLQLWQCSTHRIDWTTSASFTPWARKAACVHLLCSMT